MINLILIIQAIVQGILEWLPVSSSGFVALLSLLFGKEALSEAVDIALFMHLGSGLAALTLLRTDILMHLRNVLRQEQGNTYVDPVAYVIGLFISIITALLIYNTLISVVGNVSLAFIVIGFSLIITALITRKKKTYYELERISKIDLLILFILQGIAIIPGISRSGIVLAYLGFRRVKPDMAFRINLFIGIPILLLAGIYGFTNIINIIQLSTALVIELIVFCISFITAYYLLNYFKKIKTWLFPLIIGILLLISSTIDLIQ